jgi:hypothetical protein
VGGTGVGCAAGARLPNTEISVTTIVPATPMSAAVMVGSSFRAGSVDMATPIFLPWLELSRWFRLFYDILRAVSRII